MGTSEPKTSGGTGEFSDEAIQFLIGDVAAVTIQNGTIS
jgi:hypothetical protein